MSIIIRLQNLPLSAKSGDIRRFFGGLRIPNGGVHIVGGNKGDAFIAFETDEDARLAMRKDGSKILDTRIKLYLSSRVEMQQEIGRITKEESDTSRQRAPVGRQRSRSPFDERDPDYSRSYNTNSPSRKGRSSFARGSRSPRSRSRSPRRRSRSPRRRLRSPRRRSRSPMMPSESRRSRSPIKRTFIPAAGQRSTSAHRNDADNSLFGHGKDNGSHRDEKLVDIEKLFGLAKGSSTWKGQDFARREENALLEQKIAEALSASLSSIGKMTGMYSNPRVNDPLVHMQGERIGEPVVNMQGGKIGDPMVNVHGGRIGESIPNFHGGRFVDSGLNIQGGRVIDPGTNIQGRMSDLGLNMSSARREEKISNLNPNLMPFQHEYNSSSLREIPVQENNRFVLSTNMLPSSNMNMLRSFPPSVQPLQYPPPMNMPPLVNLPPPSLPISSMPPPLPMTTMPPPMSLTPMPSSNMKPSTPNIINPNIHLKGYFVTVSGLNPLWNVNEIQNMLKGIFVPSKNVKWELDDKWSKTGTAFVKLSRDDFMQLISHSTYSYNSRIITVSESPDFIAHKYFAPEVPSEGSLNSVKGDFYHKITGLPYEANCDNVLSFFDGLEVTDLYIIYSKNSQGFRIQGKATGIAFIAFGNSGDSSKAMSKNGHRFENSKRVINITSSTKHNMLEAKLKNNDLLSQSTTFVRVDGGPSTRPPEGGSFPMHPLCTLLTGLPQNVTKGKIINFFKKTKASPGVIHITFNEKQKQNGRVFVEFNSVDDFDRALQCHGKKMGDNVICVKQILYDEMAKCLESKQRNSFKDRSQNSLHPYSHLSNEIFRNQADLGNQSRMEENYKPTYNGRECNSGRNIIQVFEYGNKSREPIPVPSTTSNHSFGIQKPLKSCIKITKSSYNKDHKPCLPSELPSKDDVQKPNETLHCEKSWKPESSFRNVLQKSNQSAQGGEFKKPESFKNETQKSNHLQHDEEFKKPDSYKYEVQKPNQSELGKESKKPEIIFKNEIKEPDQSTHSNVTSQTEIEKESIKMDMEEEARIPVKFEVKIKPAISKSTKVENAFDNADPKKKLSKLSPERVIPTVSLKLADVAEKDKSAEKIDSNVKNVIKSNDKKAESKKTEDDKNVKTKATNDDKNDKRTDEDKNFKNLNTETNKNVKTKKY